MIKYVTTVTLGALCIFAQVGCAQEKKTDAAPEKKAEATASASSGSFTNEAQKLGYSIGIDVGNTLKQQFSGMDVDLNAIADGLKDSFAGKPKLTEAEMKKVVDAFREKMMEKMMADQAKRQEKASADAPKNLEAGKKFLEENAKKPGVKTTASGLQYQVIKEGDGPTPKPTDTVSVHYKGTLIDGTEFDSSYSRGEPTSFGVGDVIKGWTEGLQLMKVGSKYKFFIPSNLAYGERGAGGQIGPNSTLVFEVELLKIENK